MKKLSIIIPVKNEELNIQPLIKRLHKAMTKAHIMYEAIFIDDHSTDKTLNKLKTLTQGYPIYAYVKEGRNGKTYSLVEGIAKAKYEIIAMLDGDLQYPPEALLEMLEKITAGADIVVANRIKTHSSKLRALFSKSFRNIFGKKIFGLDQDVQAGLKVFRKEVFNLLNVTPHSRWAFDLEFLYKARSIGFVIESVDITFVARKEGKSKISPFKTAFELGIDALRVKLKPIEPLALPQNKKSMMGATIMHKGSTYITHTTLHHSNSAIQTFLPKQKILMGITLVIAILCLLLWPIMALQIIVGILSFIYLADVIFNLVLVLKSLNGEQEISSTPEEISNLKDSDLPIYSILCPLYKEAHIIPQFLEAISTFDYPKKKLDVMLLLEEDDKQSIDATKQMNLPSYVRVVVVPHSFPKTKPKACNYGLSLAKGEYLVIYDAEDSPDPLQLKKAYLAFQKVGEKVFCLQAKLNYYNPNQNLLTRFFTAEYSLWFDITLTGLQAFSTSIPLGGTSNHFKTSNLRKLQGWDPFNVTEDADLGIRLFRQGYKTAIIDSVTLEEANSKWGNWLRQRSRWIKGYMQTYLVHTRHQRQLIKETGWHAFLFHLIVGGKIAFILINPILWVITISYFTLYRFVGPAISVAYPAPVLYMAIISLVVGNFLFLIYYMIGCAKKEQWWLIKYVFLIPIYWVATSIAGGIAFYQLLFKPHYWEKTLHGLNTLTPLPVVSINADGGVVTVSLPTRLRNRLVEIAKKRQLFVASGFLIGSTVIVNFLNFFFNAYLGRTVPLEDFSIVTLLSGFMYMIALPITSLGGTVNYRTAILDTQYGRAHAQLFWSKVRKTALILGIIAAIGWLVSTPFLMHFFNTPSPVPFVLFSPVLLLGFMVSVDRGYLMGRLLFISMGITTLCEALLKLFFALTFVHVGLEGITYIAIPLAWAGTFATGWFLTSLKRVTILEDTAKHIGKFPQSFLVATFISGLALTAFLSVDITLAKHFLIPIIAGEYALISLVGKMIYFLGSLTTQLVTPIVSRNEGQQKNSQKTLFILLGCTLVLTSIGYIAFGTFAHITIPVLFGKKALLIVQYLPIYAMGMVAFSLSQVLISFYLAKKIYTFSLAASVITCVQIALITFFHADLWSIVLDMTITGILSLGVMVFLHLSISYVQIIETNIHDLFDLFGKQKKFYDKKSLTMLIFNWRDTKHAWAGGAEVYIHELAKRWVADGNKVTIFCGNDRNHTRNEVVDGVQIIRRGGFYTVYLWAFLYYILRFRGAFDVVIDSENGIPFFTPLYRRNATYLLIHHVHQEVHRTQLKFPFSQIALFLEGKLMPWVYRNKPVITVSESSKVEIQNLGFSNGDDIKVIQPGIDFNDFKQKRKTKNPSILYLGRLKPYKNIDVVIQAFAKVVTIYPKATFTIAGSGESLKSLQTLSAELGLTENVIFTGAVTDKQKKDLFATSWICVQPSMQEGWGITVIEANACGTPVIASNVNGLKDSIIHGRTGLLVEPRNTQAFVDAIVTCFSDKDHLKTLSKNALSWAQEFSWENSSLSFYQTIIEYDQKSNKVSYDTVSLRPNYNYEK